MKKFIVVQGYDKKFHVWSKFEYDKYIRDAVGVGAGSAYKVVIDFDGNESLLDESDGEETIQGDGWIKVEDRLPEVPPPYHDEEWGGKVEPLSVRVIVWDGQDVYEEHYNKAFGSIKGHFSSNEDNSITHWMPLPEKPNSDMQSNGASQEQPNSSTSAGNIKEKCTCMFRDPVNGICNFCKKPV